MRRVENRKPDSVCSYLDDVVPVGMHSALSVSVLVTVYNREDYLADTLQSVLASSFDAMEVIVVDDCSTDNSAAIADQFAAADPRVRAFRNEANLGDYGNRMHAASLARGKFIKYVDSDDLIYPHCLGVMVDAMERYPDAVLGLSHSLPEDREPYPWRLDPGACYRKHYLERGCLGCGPTGAIMRRDAFEGVNGFRKEWGVLSDLDLWLRLAARDPIVLLPPALVWWRRHEDQEYTKDDASEVYLRRGLELDMQALQADECPLSEPQRNEAISKKRQHFARRLLSVGLRELKPLQAIRLLRQSSLSAGELLRGFSNYR